jgi:predicted dehydrogenase
MQERDALSSANARLKPEMGGGALLDVGCYCVSVARWFYNAEPRKVQCLAHYHPAGVDTHVAAVLQFDDHRLATLEASFIAGLQQTYTVVGENGVIDLPQDAFIPWTKATRFTLREAGVESAAPTTVPGADEYQLMVEHFVDAARGDTDPLFTPSDSVGNMLVLDALAEAARSGQPVDL